MLIKKRILIILGNIILFIIAILPFLIKWQLRVVVTAEDAFITYRYARNLAKGFGFVWNPEGTSEYGSTSFLWPLFLAFIHKLLPFDILTTTLILNFILVIGTCLVIYLVIRIILKLHTMFAFLSVALFSSDLVYLHAKLGLDTIFFLFIWSIQFSLLLLLVKNSKPSNVLIAHFMILNFLLLVTRPEGLLIAIISNVVILTLNTHIRIKTTYLLVLFFWIFPTLLFFIFQISYFGYAFPNSFYLMLGNYSTLFKSVNNILGFFSNGILPLVLIVIGIWLILQDQKEFLVQFMLLMPVTSYIVSQIFINQIYNVGFRFQFPIFPILLIFFATACNDLLAKRLSLLWHECIKRRNINKMTTPERFASYLQIASMILLIFGFLFIGYAKTNIDIKHEDERTSFGRSLAPFISYGYKIALTEAGQIPYYSNWIVLDVIGLNNKHIVHNGLTIQCLKDFDPDIIQFLAYSSNYTQNWGGNEYLSCWNHTISILVNYALENNYTLVAITVPQFVDGYEWFFMKSGLYKGIEITIALTTIDDVNYFYRLNSTDWS